MPVRSSASAKALSPRGIWPNSSFRSPRAMHSGFAFPKELAHEVFDLPACDSARSDPGYRLRGPGAARARAVRALRARAKRPESFEIHRVLLLERRGQS